MHKVTYKQHYELASDLLSIGFYIVVIYILFSTVSPKNW